MVGEGCGEAGGDPALRPLITFEGVWEEGTVIF